MTDPEDKTAGQPSTPVEAGAETERPVEEDETRRRFREALDRKHERQHATAEAAERDGSEKSHGAKGPTKGRTFRRKSI